MGEENNTVAPTDYDTLRERLREPVWEHAEAVAKMTEAAEAITQLQAKVERLEKAAFEQRILAQAEARTAAAVPAERERVVSLADQVAFMAKLEGVKTGRENEGDAIEQILRAFAADIRQIEERTTQ